MRRRILGVAVSATVVAIVLFALPLAFAVRLLFVAEEQSELERAALRAVAGVDPGFATRDDVRLPASGPDITLALYRSDRTVAAGTGSAAGAGAIIGALSGHVVQSEQGGQLVVAVPVTAGGPVIGVVTATTPSSNVWHRTLLAWVAMLVLACFAVLVSVLVARRQARLLNQPLERLAETAHTLGDGDFSVRTSPSGLTEIDRTGTALDQTAVRLGELVYRERAFASNASHQLRTPLTAIRLGLESTLDGTAGELRASAREAIASTDELEQTITDLLRLARSPRTAPNESGPLDPGGLLDDVGRRWREPLAGAGRGLRLVVEPGAPASSCSLAAVRHILDVLLDNALQHGAGVVEVVARNSTDVLAIDVHDQGGPVIDDERVFERGWSGGDGHGIGLALAQDLAQSQGGRLLLARTRPGTTFTLLLPGDDPAGDDATTE